MAQFRGTLQGNRGDASRLGTKNSGLEATGNGWRIGGRIWLGHDEQADEDYIEIRLTAGSRQLHQPQLLFRGTEAEVIKLLEAGA